MVSDRTADSFDFDAIAGEYDSWYETPEGTRYDHLEKRALGRLCRGDVPGRTLLEVGMGTGWWSSFFADLGYEVTGVDISPKMVEVARAKRIPNATFEEADGAELPFAERSFASSAAITTLEFVSDPAAVVREMVRCTRENGTLYLGVLNRAAPLSKNRKHKDRGPFASARFFTVGEIHRLVGPYGNTTTRLSAFPISLKLPLPVAGMADEMQAFLGMRSGAFIAAKVEL